MNDREMELEDLITSRSGDVLRLKAKADAAGCAGCGEACQARQDRLGERRLTRFRR